MRPDQWRREEILFDVLHLGLAVGLAAAPWLFGFTAIADARRDAWLCGMVIGCASIAAIVNYAKWEQWVLLLVGVWVAISPWALAFHTTAPSAVRIDVGVGVVVALFAVLQLWFIRHTPRSVAH